MEEHHIQMLGQLNNQNLENSMMKGIHNYFLGLGNCSGNCLMVVDNLRMAVGNWCLEPGSWISLVHSLG